MKLAAIRTNVELHKACPEVEVVKRLKATFPEFSSDLAKEIPGYAEVDMNQVIFNRHHSTESPTCKDLVVHLFSGDDPKFWMAQEKNGVVIICIELTKGEIFETAICMDGWNNWQGVERSMFFLLDRPAGL